MGQSPPVMAMRILGELKSEIDALDDPLITAAGIAIAGNVIDMGINGDVTVPMSRAPFWMTAVINSGKGLWRQI